MGWLWPGWDQLWPNLLADIIYATPAFVIHHVLMRRHLSAHHDRLAQTLGRPTSTKGP